ncbi:class I SAM-dependent methyltransferase [Rhizorhapis suberifaciens]|uniref:Methyltransferase domain-containing protein n=1 Tax=Rhizorhapis suberifaciens TaxID=13656 RepID=A0A840HQ15_9SPHN|nr:class I SAM-dependent methyltransferase [Rhizorhapis suberifaciens]MBB4639749.1 hypothetical protein [Rhizorhapis suberifaciens]
MVIEKQFEPWENTMRSRITPGQLARALLGSKFHIAGRLYRRIFVDMDKVTDCIMHQLPAGAHVLDIGGGDGYVVDMLLAKRPDIRVTMIDIATDIGRFIRAEHEVRVTIRAQTELSAVEGDFDAFTITDVIHHVPQSARAEFLSSIAGAAQRTRCNKIIVKDVQPGKLRALLALWGDLYITGDKGVSLVGMEDIALPGFRRTYADMPDYPNYCITFSA